MPKQAISVVLQRLVESNPRTTKWHLVLDNLNIHQSESLMRWVAQSRRPTIRLYTVPYIL